MKTLRLLTNICSTKLPETRDFYVQYFGFEVGFDSDWFVNLLSPDRTLEIGVLHAAHDLLPDAFRNHRPAGVYLTLVVENVNQWHREHSGKGAKIIQPPEDTFYGQRRCLVLDPNGLLIDVSTPIHQL